MFLAVTRGTGIGERVGGGDCPLPFDVFKHVSTGKQGRAVRWGRRGAVLPAKIKGSRENTEVMITAK